MSLMKKCLFFLIFIILISCNIPYDSQKADGNNTGNNTVNNNQEGSPQYDGTSQDIGNLKVFPDINPWNYPVSSLDVHPDSNDYINLIGINRGLHTDFGSGTYEGSYIGIPYIVISDNNPQEIDIVFNYSGESDPLPYIIPDNAPIEGQGPDILKPSGDRHVIVINTATNMLYEIYAAEQLDHLKWTGGSGAKYDLTKTDLRPIFWTSADAAGLPLFPYLVRYEEIEKGVINHAIRFTLTNSKIRNSFITPARHSANSSYSHSLLPMGARLRLKSIFDITSFSSVNQIILTAMKEYGLILADNGSDMFISGSPDPRWDNNDLHDLGRVKAGDFEVVFFDENNVVNMP